MSWSLVAAELSCLNNFSYCSFYHPILSVENMLGKDINRIPLPVIKTEIFLSTWSIYLYHNAPMGQGNDVLFTRQENDILFTMLATIIASFCWIESCLVISLFLFYCYKLVFQKKKTYHTSQNSVLYVASIIQFHISHTDQFFIHSIYLNGTNDAGQWWKLGLRKILHFIKSTTIIYH